MRIIVCMCRSISRVFHGKKEEKKTVAFASHHFRISFVSFATDFLGHRTHRYAEGKSVRLNIIMLAVKR